MKEGHLRSIIKAISWRLIATTITTLLVYIFTRKLILALEIGLLEMIIKIAFYYMHERVWGKVLWGKPSHPLEDIKLKKELSNEDKKKIEEQLKSLGYM